MEEDLYETLGLSKHASDAEIRKVSYKLNDSFIISL